MRNRWKSLIIALLLLLPFGVFGTQPATAAESTIKGTGVVTGTVTGEKPFTAAHVYLRGQEGRGPEIRGEVLRWHLLKGAAHLGVTPRDLLRR